jgi:hypothetical protein
LCFFRRDGGGGRRNVDGESNGSAGSVNADFVKTGLVNAGLVNAGSVNAGSINSDAKP